MLFFVLGEEFIEESLIIQGAARRDARDASSPYAQGEQGFRGVVELNSSGRARLARADPGGASGHGNRSNADWRDGRELLGLDGSGRALACAKSEPELGRCPGTPAVD